MVFEAVEDGNSVHGRTHGNTGHGAHIGNGHISTESFFFLNKSHQV